MGYHPILAPMLRIEATNPPVPSDLSDVQAVLITSTNGIEHFATLTPQRDLAILAVGDRTADAARNMGFESVSSASGDGADLLALARGLPPNKGAILHPRGADTAVSFDALIPEGYDFRDLVVYQAVQASELPKDASLHLFGAALVYSARTAEALAAALSHHATLDPAQLVVIGISESALRPLQNIGFKHLISASKPNETAIFEALQTHLPPAK
jgi:uroporphyrinogen-III synthase